MIFKTMKREALLKALEGHKDILKPAFEDNEKFFKRLACPSCGGEVMPIVNPKTPFKEGDILPNFLGRCRACGVEFDPYTGIQVTLP